MICQDVDGINYLEAIELIAACFLKARNREEESLWLEVSGFWEGLVFIFECSPD